MSEVRGGGWEEPPHVRGQGWRPGGATPHPRSGSAAGGTTPHPRPGVVAWRSHPVPKARGSGREEQPMSEEQWLPWRRRA